MGFLIVLGIVILLVIWVMGMYNGLVKLRNQVKNAWSQIDVQLKRRHDLIPNLVETAKGYMKHERETFESITKARTQAMQAKGVAESAKAEGQLSEALSKFMLVVENYPDLKASQNFLALQEELTTTENKVGFARQFYNDQVQQFNIRIESVPTNIIANMFGFKQAEFFEIQVAGEREVPQVKF
jgi:LemA protein